MATVANLNVKPDNLACKPLPSAMGFEVVAEWYWIGEFPAQGRMKDFSTLGRLGDITGRPNDADLADVAARVTGVLRV